MNSEERMHELFQSGVDLLKEGISPVAAAQSLNLNGETDEFVQLFDIVEASYDLPHYKMPTAVRAALLARLIAKTEDKNVPMAVLPPTRQTRRPTSWPRRPLVSWNWFLRIQQAVVVAALVLALGVIILQANQGTGSNPQEPITPAATALPSPVIAPTPQLTPGPVVTAPAMPPATITAPLTVVITQTTIAPSQVTTTTSTSTSTSSPSVPQPTSRGAVITQPVQNDTNQAPTKTVPVAPKTSTPTARLIPSPSIGATTAPKTVAPTTTKTNTQVALAATVPAPTATAAVAAPTQAQSAPTATSQSQPVPTPAPPTQVPTAPPAATPTVDDHGGGGGGSTKTASPTPQPTNTQKLSGNSNKIETPKPTG